jgi:hypothetical protein
LTLSGTRPASRRAASVMWRVLTLKNLRELGRRGHLHLPRGLWIRVRRRLLQRCRDHFDLPRGLRRRPLLVRAERVRREWRRLLVRRLLRVRRRLLLERLFRVRVLLDSRASVQIKWRLVRLAAPFSRRRCAKAHPMSVADRQPRIQLLVEATSDTSPCYGFVE